MKLIVSDILKHRKDLPEDYAEYVHLKTTGEQIIAEVESFTDPDKPPYSVSLKLVDTVTDPVSLEVYEAYCGCPATRACKHLAAVYLVASEKSGKTVPVMARKAILKEVKELKSKTEPYVVLQCEKDGEEFGVFLFDSFYFGGTEENPSDYDIREWVGSEIVYVASENGEASLVCTKVRPSAVSEGWRKDSQMPAVEPKLPPEATVVPDKAPDAEDRHKAAANNSMAAKCEALRRAGHELDESLSGIADILETYAGAVKKLMGKEK